MRARYVTPHAHGQVPHKSASLYNLVPLINCQRMTTAKQYGNTESDDKKAMVEIQCMVYYKRMYFLFFIFS